MRMRRKQNNKDEEVGVCKVSEEVEERDDSKKLVEVVNGAEPERVSEEEHDDNNVVDNCRICKNKFI